MSELVVERMHEREREGRFPIGDPVPGQWDPQVPPGLWSRVRQHPLWWDSSLRRDTCDLWAPAENFSAVARGGEFGEPVTLCRAEVENNKFRAMR